MTIIIIDDHQLVRKGIISVLKNDDKIESIYEAENGETAFDIINKYMPEIMLVDIKLKNGLSGLSIIEEAKRKNLPMKMIILTSYLSIDDFETAENLNVDGYIFKDALDEDIKYAISLVYRGQKYYSPSVVKYCSGSTNKSKLREILTKREIEVLKEVGKGMTNDEIAKFLFISENTVKKHISNILSKLNLGNRAQVVRFINNI
jgi:two-component system nitrate/nitrite response regulator NarL